MLSLITQIEMKAREKSRRVIPAAVQHKGRECPCRTGSGGEEVGTQDVRSTLETARGG